MSGRGRLAALAVAGLAAAALLGLSGYVIARDTIALPATSLPSGGALAPSAATLSGAATERPAPPAPATTPGIRVNPSAEAMGLPRLAMRNDACE